MNYKLDCQYLEQQRLRPYCHKLQREIRPRDCDGCGWYRLFIKDKLEHNKLEKKVKDDN